jgi:4'-phosphopantetheinyl transferase
MPLLSHGLELPSGTMLALWQVGEPEGYFKTAMAWSPAELEVFGQIQGNRRLESMAARLALHQLTGADTPWKISKDAHNKPNLVEHPAYHCALSHSHGVAAALLSDRVCGVDLQRFTDKMDKLASKFVNEPEFQLLEQYPSSHRLDMLHQIWSAKEAMYKVYGRKSLDFKEHLHVQDFTNISSGSIRKQNEEILCTLNYQWLTLAGLGRYVICVATEL